MAAFDFLRAISHYVKYRGADNIIPEEIIDPEEVADPNIQDVPQPEENAPQPLEAPEDNDSRDSIEY
jgi:hypothetical protein